VERLLDIYFMLSAGRHHLTSDLAEAVVEDSDMEGEAEESTVGKFLSLTGRLVSTRYEFCLCKKNSVVL
jgi:hypothetical protein